MNVWKEYLVVGTQKDFYIFRRNGEYLKKAFQIGRGPDEFIMPTFSNVIRNGMLFIKDPQKSHKFIYCLNITNGTLRKIPKTDEEIIASFIPDTDSTLLIINQKAIIFNPPHIFSSEFSLVKQDLKGNLLYKYPLGTYTENEWPFHYLKYSFLIANNNILIISPECDSISLFRGEKKPLLIWQNIFDSRLSSTEFRMVNLVYFSKNDVILSERVRENKGNSERLKKSNYLLIDKHDGKISSVQRLYFIDKRVDITYTDLNLQENGQFAVTINASDFEFLFKNQTYKKYIDQLTARKPDSITKPTTSFDNPFILLGRFK